MMMMVVVVVVVVVAVIEAAAKETLSVTKCGQFAESMINTASQGSSRS